jgi:conjugal transfer pilus assembly protein TraU
MKHIYKIILLITLLISNTYADREVYHFYENLDWQFFFDKLKFKFELCSCDIEDTGELAAGFKMRMVEPIGFLETSNTPWDFVGLGMKEDKSFLRKQGVSRDTDSAGNFKHAHFIIFPPLGWTIGLVQDYICFERGNIFNLAYLSEVIPSYNNDIIGLMEESAKPISKIWFANPVAELACSADCVTSSLGYPSNSLYWCDGCRGSVTASDTGFARTGRPYEDAESIIFRVLNRMHLYGGMLKTKESFFAYNPAGSNLKSTLCKARYFPVIIKDQYYIQMAKKDKSWDAEPFGKIRFHYDFKSTVKDEDSNFFWLWRERDMCAGAMKCRSTFTGQ